PTQSKPFQQEGPLLITHWGLSGPAVLKLSAWAARPLAESNYQAQLTVNWLASWNETQVRQALQEAKQNQGKKALWATPLLALPKRLWQHLLSRAGIAPELTWAVVSKSQLSQILAALRQTQLAVTGKGIFKEEFVACGGVAL